MSFDTPFDNVVVERLNEIVRLLGNIETLLINQPTSQKKAVPHNPIPEKNKNGKYECAEFVDGKEGQVFEYDYRAILEVPMNKREEFKSKARSSDKAEDGKWALLYKPHKMDVNQFYWLFVWV